MANRRISHAKGKGSINHNNRNHIYKNVDESRTPNNIYYAKESLEDAYQKCFGEAVANYNTKQKRADRKIEDYYTHLFGNAQKDTVATSSNREKSFYEIVVGIGDKNSCAVGSADGELAAKILDEYAKGFQERNPNLYVFNSVLHMDEKTPHLHIDYVPVADGYKNGLAVRNSQSVALQKMGFGKEKNSINEWRKQERQILKELCQKYGLEITEESKGRGKTLTPNEYKDMRDEVKGEIQANPEIMGEIKEEIKHEATAELQSEISKEKTKLKNTKEQLTQETASIEGKIALEKPIKSMLDGVREETRGWGSNKKPHVIIEVPNMTKEQALMVLKAAQQGAKDRANTKKYKAERDTAISEKDTATAERDAAIKDKALAEKQKATAQANAKTAEEKAKSATVEADKMMEQAKALYNQQLNINNLYQNSTTNLNHYKGKSEELTAKVEDLQDSLEAAYYSLGAMAKANASLLFDPKLKIANITPEQERLLQATRNYAALHSRNEGFEDIAQDIEKHYEITKGMQTKIDELIPKTQTKKRSHGYDRG